MATLIPTRPGRWSSHAPRDPFVSFQAEMNQLISDFFRHSDGGDLRSVITPSFDLSETDDAYQIQMDLPGVDPNDIEIEVQDNTVLICGERKCENEQEGKSFHRAERQWGRFCRSAQLPSYVDRDKVDAECRNGILTVTLPKSAESMTHRVPVKTG